MLRIIGVNAFSRTSAIAAFSLAGFCGNTIPRSSRNARIWLMTAVRRETNPVTNPMHRPQVELVVGLDRDEAHVLALDGFGDSLRIDFVDAEAICQLVD
jgi:hypothetical protein